MRAHFNTIALMAKLKTEEVADTLRALITHLQALNKKILIEKETTKIIPDCSLPAIRLDKMLKNQCELIIVVGGDGSLLHAAHAAAMQDIPVLGVNRGFLGFLTDILPNKLNKINSIFTGNYIEEQRFLLTASITTSTHHVFNSIALNDFVILSSNAGQMIEFSVFIDEEFMCGYRADGIIISTPTGSTAHALSGGGPILYPELEAIVLLPMFSHNLSSRPIVIKSSSSIKIVLNDNCGDNYSISCDGKIHVLAPNNNAIVIKKAEKKLRLLHPTDYNYFETLRSKLHWERR